STVFPAVRVHGGTPMRVGFITYNAQAGDAVGNQVAEKVAVFLDHGADVRVFLHSNQRLHPALHDLALPIDKAECHGEAWLFLSTSDLVIVEYSQYFQLLEFLPLLAGGKPRVLVNYHGVTPVALWRCHNRDGLAQGLRQRGLVWCADAALA